MEFINFNIINKAKSIVSDLILQNKKIILLKNDLFVKK